MSRTTRAIKATALSTTANISNDIQVPITTTVHTQLAIRCPDDIIDGSKITKDLRHELFGKMSGGNESTEPEKFQRRKIVEGTGIECSKTNIRLNLRTNELVSIAHPNKQKDGFDYTEDMDGVQEYKDNKVYLNMKCIVGKGGSQTRSLREVYWFVRGQLEYLLKNPNAKVFFANVLDGDEANHHINKFEYLTSLDVYTGVKNKVYVGDLKGYFDWFSRTMCE